MSAEPTFGEEKNWSWRAVSGPLEPTTGCLDPWAYKCPPPWWPVLLLRGLHGSDRNVQEELHSKFLGATEAVRMVEAAVQGADEVGSLRRLGAGLGHVIDFAAGSSGQCLTGATPRHGCRVGIGHRARQNRTLLFEEPLISETDFPDPSSTTVSELMVLNWNAGNLVRNLALVDLACGSFSLCFLQESSTTLGEPVAESRAICWSDSPDGQRGCFSVLAGASGRKVVLATYGSEYSGQIFRPHKKNWKKGDRLLAACVYTADVTWLNKHGDLVRRAGLDSWRVTIFHMDHVEAKSGENGSGGKTCAAAFGLAMRDKYRLFAGDFNQVQHYLCSIYGAPGQSRHKRTVEGRKRQNRKKRESQNRKKREWSKSSGAPGQSRHKRSAEGMKMQNRKKRERQNRKKRERSKKASAPGYDTAVSLLARIVSAAICEKAKQRIAPAVSGRSDSYQS